MEGTDVETGNIDQNRSHDHTFIGNGCLPGYSAGGSGVSCSTRILITFDNDSQKNGTYYNYSATTLGTGASISTKNALTPDTFCPLGWQLPYGGTDGDYYDKSKSWNFLISTYNFTNDNAGTTKAMSYPVEFIRSGQYDWNTGKLYNQNSTGTYWTVTNYSSDAAYRNEIYLGRFNIYQLDKRNGYALRCTPSSTARWKEQISVSLPIM